MPHSDDRNRSNTLAAEPLDLDLDRARGLRGSGWDGDLDGLRASRAL